MTSPVVKKVLDRLEGERELAILESNNEIKQPKLWARAKELAEERFGVYGVKAHSWAYKWYEQKGGTFVEHHQKDADGNEIPHEEIEEAATTRIPAQNGNVYDLMYTWRGKGYYCKMFFPNTKKPSTKEVQIALNQVYPSATLKAFHLSHLMMRNL